MSRKRQFGDEERKERHREACRKWCAANREKAREIYKRWAKANPEKAKKWAREHPDKARNSVRKCRAANPERHRELSREWYAAHAAQAMRASQKWHRAHPEAMCAVMHKRRARKAGNGGSYTVAEWLALREKYNNECIGPGPHGGPLCRDHVVPIKLGGTSNIDNIQPLCKRCNSRKHTKVVDYRQH